MSLKKYIQDNLQEIQDEIGAPIKFQIYYKIRNWESIRFFLSAYKYVEIKTNEKGEFEFVTQGRKSRPKRFIDFGMALMHVRKDSPESLIIDYFENTMLDDKYETFKMEKYDAMKLYFNRKDQNTKR